MPTPTETPYGDGSARKRNEVIKRITETLDSVVEQLAEKLRVFSSQILEGDVTTVFVEANEYYERKLGR